MSSAYVWKTRELEKGAVRLDRFNGSAGSDTWTFHYGMAQKTLTRGNPWRRNGPQVYPNVGGDFWTKMIDVELNPYPINNVFFSSGLKYGMTGSVICDDGANTTSWLPKVSSLTFPGYSSSDSYGATAVSRCAPTNSHADVAVAVGELYNEGLPKSALLSARGRGHSATKKASDEYLGLEFGIKPFISDVRKTVNALRDSSRILERYARDSGKLIRKTYEFPLEESTSSTKTSTVYPWNTNSSSYDKSFTRTSVTKTTRRVWFSGAFTYRALTPERNDVLGSIERKYREVNHLLGLRVTPDVAWNLMPWSWLVDWKTNVGDVLHNISMFQTDGLVMVRGYVMVELVTTKTTVCTGGSFRNWNSIDVPNHPVVITTSEKFRRAANPFGFGITPGSLSSRQWSILAALGLSKGSGTTTLRNE